MHADVHLNVAAVTTTTARVHPRWSPGAIAAFCKRHGVDIRSAALPFRAAHPVVASSEPRPGCPDEAKKRRVGPGPSVACLPSSVRRTAARAAIPPICSGHIDCAKKAWEGRMRCRKLIRNPSAEPCGWKARPVAPDQRPEASLAWGGATRTAKRR